jgi:ribonuclease HI/exonuclease III
MLDTLHLRILQINLNKSEKAHLDLLNTATSKDWDIVLIQEPHTINKFNAIQTPTNFRPVFPENRGRDNTTVRSIIWVSSALETHNWEIINIPNTNDLSAIQLKGDYGKLTIFNIYNDCNNPNTENALALFLRNHHEILQGENAHMIWAGDFNRHHPLWDRDEDVHLFTAQYERSAEKLIDMLADHNMAMPLPKGIPTLEHMRSKRYSRPDNVFCTSNLEDLITKCDVIPHLRPPCTDHFPIATHLSLTQTRAPSATNYNFRDVDWDIFRRTLKENMDLIPHAAAITTETQLTQAAEDLTNAIHLTIQSCIRRSKPRPDTKRWWNSDLRKSRKGLNKLRTISYRNRTITDHPAHQELRTRSNKYGEDILQAKRQHWSDYLEDMDASGIWTANKYLREPAGDGGNPRIPTLRTTNINNQSVEVNDSREKAALFAKTFFPPPPEEMNIPYGFAYPNPIPDPPPITIDQIKRQILRLSPYKAYGPDEIPNIVLQKCLEIIVDHLYHIYGSILKLGKYYDPWREFTTVILRKPGKPNYETPKAYRPIALLSTLAKVLTAIVAEDISRLVEKHQLLPKTHFGGRPGRTTTDAIHYLVHKIKEAWRGNKVVSILFLDVEGAFPNAVTQRLLHNLRKRRIPTVYINFIEQLLTGRRTKLKFDDFISESINILNGIGQGDPLSMILYILYNADLLDLPTYEEKEDSLGFVDDVALVAIGEDFTETTGRLERMMVEEDGGLQWSTDHNSKFEVNKSAVLHVTRRTQVDPDNEDNHIPLHRPQLRIQGQLIQEVTSYKYLGTIIDDKLQWNEQAQRATANATKWLLQFRRLTRPTTGVSSKLMRRLYLAVALPKITYGLDVWYSPPNKPIGAINNSGSVGTLKSLQKLQRIATLAITGGLRSTPTDLLDAHAGVLPTELALAKICHRATIRLLSLPETHPLYKVVQKAKRSPPSKHPSPINNLIRIFQLNGTKIETIFPKTEDPYRAPRFTTRISTSRESSIDNEKHDDADFKVFTDGSDHDGGVGAAAILYKKGTPMSVSHLKAYLGPSTEHNSYEAEVVGGILAMWLVRNNPETLRKKISIYSDNQAFLKTAAHPKAVPGQYLLREFNASANDFTATISLKWISGHSNVRGNERADKLAKEGAEGRASRQVDLPPILRQPLPISISAINCEHLKSLKSRWAANWHESPRRHRIQGIDDTFPFNGYRKRQDRLSRAHASYLLQVRSGHLPLNYYLHRIKKSDTKQCTACRIEQGDETSTETISHFIYECAAYNSQRLTLIRAIGATNIALKDIMMNTKHMKALAKYIIRTGRLKMDR